LDTSLDLRVLNEVCPKIRIDLPLCHSNFFFSKVVSRLYIRESQVTMQLYKPLVTGIYCDISSRRAKRKLSSLISMTYVAEQNDVRDRE
jgi:hypothetical protein